MFDVLFNIQVFVGDYYVVNNLTKRRLLQSDCGFLLSRMAWKPMRSVTLVELKMNSMILLMTIARRQVFCCGIVTLSLEITKYINMNFHFRTNNEKCNT